MPQYKSLPRMGKQLAGSKMKWRNGSDKARSSHHIRRAPLRIQGALPQCRARITILVTTTSAASISEHVSPFPDQLFRGSFLGSLGLPGRGISQLPRDPRYRLFLTESDFGVSCCSLRETSLLHLAHSLTVSGRKDSCDFFRMNKLRTRHGE